MIVYSHPDCLLKFNGSGHPERKERLISVTNSIKAFLNLKAEFRSAPKADLETISLVHPKDYIKKMFSNIPEQGFQNVEKAIRLKKDPRWYGRTRYGYCRAEQPIAYVSRIQTRYDEI